MLKYEKLAWEKSLYVCGIDEVGRGCLAGPLLTAAVILPQNKRHKLLKDSKKLSEKEREVAYEWIIKNCYCSFALVDHNIIDKINNAEIISLLPDYIVLNMIFEKTGFEYLNISDFLVKYSNYKFKSSKFKTI